MVNGVLGLFCLGKSEREKDRERALRHSPGERKEREREERMNGVLGLFCPGKARERGRERERERKERMNGVLGLFCPGNSGSPSKSANSTSQSVYPTRP